MRIEDLYPRVSRNQIDPVMSKAMAPAGGFGTVSWNTTETKRTAAVK